jgi:hypothetical protein
MTPRDVQALDLAVAAGLVQTTTADLVPGQPVERSVLDVVAFHLGRCRGRVDDVSGGGRHQSIAFATVSSQWREAWRPASGNAASPNGSTGGPGASYPMAIVTGEVRRVSYSMNPHPQADPSDTSDDPVDWISPDGQLAVWHRGDEDGEARVIVYASYEAHAHALQAAVERALRGGVAVEAGAAEFPLPEGHLPTAFQGSVPPALYPRCTVEVLTPSFAPRDEAEGARDGCWRADVRFWWRAPSLVCLPAGADYDPRFIVTTTAP